MAHTEMTLVVSAFCVKVLLLAGSQDKRLNIFKLWTCTVKAGLVKVYKATSIEKL